MSSLLMGYIYNNVTIAGTLTCMQPSSFGTVSATTITANSASLTSASVTNQHAVGTLVVNSTLNTKDPSSGALTAAALTVAGGSIISGDELVKGTASATTVACTTVNATNVNSSALSTLASLTVPGTETVGGKISWTNTADYVSSASPGAFSIAGGGAISGSLALGQSTCVLSSATVSTSSTQSGTGSGSNIIRVRSNDTTNTSVRLSLANTALANAYYDSSLVLWNLGSSITATNYERMTIGVNSAGGYINYLYGGTGTLKQFNILQGSTFSMGGALSLTSSLNINGVTRIAAPTTPYTLTEPTALPSTNGMVLSCSTSGVQSWALPPASIYTGDGATAAPVLVTLTTSPRWFVLTQTLSNTSGQLVFYLTTTGTSSGAALGTFQSIAFAARSPNANAAVTTGPWASESYRNSIGVVCNVLTGNSTGIVVGGTAQGVRAAPSGTIVTCLALVT